MKRRQFLKTGAVAATAAAVMPNIAIGSPKESPYFRRSHYVLLPGYTDEVEIVKKFEEKIKISANVASKR